MAIPYRMAIRLNQNIGLGIVAVLFLLVPQFSNTVLYATDNLLIRGILIAACVGGLYYNMLFGILTFMLVARIFLERNNRKIKDAKALINNAVKNGGKQEVVLQDELGDIADTQANVDRQVYSPGNDALAFIPNGDMGMDDFQPMDYTLNEKKALTGVVEGEAAATSVFGDVHPAEATNAV